MTGHVKTDVNQLQLFLPCAAGVEGLLASEAQAITGASCSSLRGGVRLAGDWRAVMQLNLHSRLAQRVLVELSHSRYQGEQDVYDAARAVPWEEWFGLKQSFKVEITAQHSPLKSLNFALLRVKDAIADRFRDISGARPDVLTRWPDVRVFAHLDSDQLTLYIDSSGEPLFKRGWREDRGEAPLKETLAAAMLAASGWDARTALYDPCCGSGTIPIEAAQIACGIAPGMNRRFGFEKLVPFQASAWRELQQAARAAQHTSTAPLFGSDVAHRMVDFAQRNAERAGVAGVVSWRGGDAVQRQPPLDAPGVMLLNPPYGERIEAGGLARPGREADRGQGRQDAPSLGRQAAQTDGPEDFFLQLARHWKDDYKGWTAWILTPDLKLPGRMRMKESRRVPFWNGPIECRMFKFDIGMPGAPRTTA
jgi:putative N6-adenine-specific DNA methylase